MSTLEALIQTGFDLSWKDEEEGTVHVRCSQCDAMVIQGIPCHERGCPHGRRKSRVEEVAQ